MVRPSLPDLGVVLTFLRGGQGWSQAALGAAAGISPNLVNDYERGRKTLTRGRLEELAAVLGLPPDRIDATLACLAANQAAARSPRDPADRMGDLRRRIEALAAVAGREMQDFARSLLSLLTFEGEALVARQRAEILGPRLKRRTPGERRMLVEEREEYRSWAVAEWLAAASLEAAGDDADEALALADLSLFVAERIPGEETFRRRVQGYAWAHVANARRVQGRRLPAADAAFATSRKLWEEGAVGDPEGLLDEAIVPWLEATLRHAQERFPEAVKRIEEGLAVDRGAVRARLLYTEARILEGQGSPEGAITALREAASWVDASREPRLALGIRFQLLVNLCHLGQAGEAERGLPEVRALAERAGKELDQVRVVWLVAKIAAGLGRAEEARADFEQVRRELAARKLPFDHALASLELAVLHLERGRTVEVRTLAREILPIFREQEVPEESLKALRLFCAAAERDTATAELARRVIAYLYQARQNPGLLFEPGQRAGAP